MKTLHLTLKKKWFDMIVLGIKKEEYRELKPYWINRLGSPNDNCVNYDLVTFRNGYAKDAPTITIQCKGITIGKARPEWSDNWQGDVFIIKLGKIV
jgi:hypothetical protein